jgi:hypothetical protein
MDEGGSRTGTSLSEEAQCGGPLRRAPLLGTPKDMSSTALAFRVYRTGVGLGGL